MTTSTANTDPTTATSRWAKVRASLRDHREARVAHAQLQRELAEFRTPSAVNDLLAAVDRQEPARAEEIRAILSNNLRDYQSTRVLGGVRG